MNIHAIRFLVIACIASSMLMFNGCAQLQGIANTLSNLSRLNFKLNNVTGFRLANIDIGNKSSVSDFSLMDGINALNAYRSKSLPANFTLNLNVSNPNDGTNGTRSVPATLAGLAFRLLIDNKPTINGDISSPVQIPSSNQAVNIPIGLGLDMYQFFGERSYEDIANLAFALGGKSGSASRITLDAQPTVQTSFGNIQYPGRINIVDKEYRN